MPAPIEDKYARLKLSRQRKYQLRNLDAGLCQVCGRKAIQLGYCRLHAKWKRKKARQRYHSLHPQAKFYRPESGRKGTRGHQG